MSQLGQTQLQQAPQLAQQQGVVVGSKVAGIRAGEGQHTEIAEPHQGHRVDQHIVAKQRLLLALAQAAKVVILPRQTLTQQGFELLALCQKTLLGPAQGKLLGIEPEPQPGQAQPLDKALPITALTSNRVWQPYSSP